MVKKKQIKSAKSKAKDLAAAKTPKRRRRKADNQRRGQRSDSDLHHTKGGKVVRVSKAYNRATHTRGEVGRRRKKRRGV